MLAVPDVAIVSAAAFLVVAMLLNLMAPTFVENGSTSRSRAVVGVGSAGRMSKTESVLVVPRFLVVPNSSDFYQYKATEQQPTEMLHFRSDPF